MATKIPFAYSLEQKRIVEVASVRSGKACGCICPSCGQAVQARKGEKNTWCFAHDPTPEDVPDIDCKISFLVSARQFIADAAIAGDIPDFTTTEAFYSFVEILDVHGEDEECKPRKYIKLKLADEHHFHNVEWEKGPGHYDLSFVLSGAKINIYLSYPGKDCPELPSSKGLDGYIELNIKSLEERYIKSGSSGFDVLTLARDLFTGTDYKEWIYHPRVDSDSFREKISKSRALAQKQLCDEYAEKLDQARQRNKSASIRPISKYNNHAQKDDSLTPEERAAANKFPDLFRYHVNHGYSKKSAAQKIISLESRDKE